MDGVIPAALPDRLLPLLTRIWHKLLSPSLLRLLAPALGVAIVVAGRWLWRRAGQSALGRAVRWWCLAAGGALLLAALVYLLAVHSDDPEAAAAARNPATEALGRTFPAPIAAAGAVAAAVAALAAGWSWRSARLAARERRQLAAEWRLARRRWLRGGALAGAAALAAASIACVAAAAGAPQVPAAPPYAGPSPAGHGGTLWVGTGAGLNRLISTSRGPAWEALVRPSVPLPANRVTAIAAGPAGEVWVATNGGLAQLARSGDRTHWQTATVENAGLPYPTVLGLAVDGRGVAWAATGHGAAMVRPRGSGGSGGSGNRAFTGRNAPLLHQILDAVYVDPAGRIWFGGAGGVNVYQPPASSDGEGEWLVGFNAQSTGGGLPDSQVYTIVGDSRGRVWFGTAGGAAALTPAPARHGLGAYDADRWQTFTRANAPLAHDQVHAILEDRQGRIWFGTHAGISVLDEAIPAPAGDTGVRPGARVPAYGRGRWQQFTAAGAGAAGAPLASGYWRTAGGGAPGGGGQPRGPDVPRDAGDAGASTVDVDTPGLASQAPHASSGIPHPWVRALSLGPDGRIWAGTGRGLSVYDPARPGQGWLSYHAHPVRRWTGYLWPAHWQQNILSEDVTALAWVP